MARHLADSMTRAAFDAGNAARDSMVTIAARLPIFAECLTAPSAAGLAEWNQACTEKVAAGLEGGMAALSAWNAMLIQSAFSPMTPLAFAQGAMSVMEQASGPGHKRVRANAARLSRRSKG